MAKSLLEQLPEIVAAGRKEAERILESIESRHRVSLQTREWVLPAKDSAAQDWITSNTRQGHLQDAADAACLHRLSHGRTCLHRRELDRCAGRRGLWRQRHPEIPGGRWGGR